MIFLVMCVKLFMKLAELWNEACTLYANMFRNEAFEVVDTAATDNAKYLRYFCFSHIGFLIGEKCWRLKNALIEITSTNPAYENTT